MAQKQIDLLKYFEYTEKERELMLRVLEVFKELPWDDYKKINKTKFMQMLYEKFKETDEMPFNMFEKTINNILAFGMKHVKMEAIPNLIPAACDGYNKMASWFFNQLKFLIRHQEPKQHVSDSIEPQAYVEDALRDKRPNAKDALDLRQRHEEESDCQVSQIAPDFANTVLDTLQLQAGPSRVAKRVHTASSSTLQDPKRVRVQSPQGKLDIPIRAALFVASFNGDLKMCLDILIHQNSWYNIGGWTLYGARSVGGDNYGIYLTLGIPADEAEKVLRRERRISFLQDVIYVCFYPRIQPSRAQTEDPDTDRQQQQVSVRGPTVTQTDMTGHEISRPEEEMAIVAMPDAKSRSTLPPASLPRDDQQGTDGGGPKTIAWMHLLLL